MMYVAIYFAAGLVMAIVSAVYMFAYYGRNLSVPEIINTVNNVCTGYAEKTNGVYQSLSSGFLIRVLKVMHVMIFPIEVIVLYGAAIVALDHLVYEKKNAGA